MKVCSQCGTRFSEPVAFCPHDGTPTQDLEDAPPADPLIGRVVDQRYRIESVLGEGGMGIVYLISHVVLGKKMALKVLRGEMAKDADVVQRFMQEAQSASSIGHSNIIDISDFGRLPDGSVYFVMEHLDGQSLSHFVERGGSIPMATGVHIVRQIASALDAAHARGIVHRDLKPDNVYLVNQGGDTHFVKVLDFGIAKVGGASSKLTKTGMIFGTPHYMSPEQAAGQSVDLRTDIYALGVIMYEMFTGKVPFDGDTFMGILSKHMFEQPVPPSSVTGKGLGAIEDVILRALAKKAEERYQTMRELVSDLDVLAAGGTIDMPGRIGPPGNLADVLEPPSRTEMQLQGRALEPEASLPTSKAPLILGGLFALALLGVVVGGAVYLWMPPEPIAALSGAAPAEPPSAPTSAPPTVASPPPEATQPTEPAAPAPEPERRVEIESEPVGAEVRIDGMIVGNTPVALPVPDEGERVVELHLRGYETTRVMLTSASPDSLHVDLEQESRASSRPRHSPPAPTPPTATPPTPTPAPARPPPHPRGSSEVVDPWQ